jgi:hypothetical protein
MRCCLGDKLVEQLEFLSPQVIRARLARILLTSALPFLMS